MSGEARAAVYGLIGALIGSLASIGGVYLTAHQTASGITRGTYVSFIAKAERYSADLIEVQYNTEAYADVRAKLQTEVAPLIAAEVSVRLLGNGNLGAEAKSAVDAFFNVYLPADRNQLNMHDVHDANDLGTKLLGNFTQDAIAQLSSSSDRLPGV